MTHTRVGKQLSLTELKRELADVARIGQAFVDGDLCWRAYRPIGDRFLNSDDIDFAPETCIPLKQTLLRLERLSRVPCAVALWRRRPDMPTVGEPLLYGSVTVPLASLFRPPASGYGEYRPPKMFPELAAAFRHGRTAWRISRDPVAALMAARGRGVNVTGFRRPAFVECFAPVRDSMGRIAAVLEVFTATGT